MAIFLIVSLLFLQELHAEKKPFIFPPPAPHLLKALQGGQVLANCQVHSEKIFEHISSHGLKKVRPIQTLDFHIQALHPNPCEWALPYFARYEQYEHLLSSVKKVRYHPKTQMLYLLFDHTLAPYPFSLEFQLPRIKEEGTYSFVFHRGLLPGLHGAIDVRNITLEGSHHCLIQVRAKWSGNDTGLLDSLLSLLAETVSRAGLDKLIRASTL